MPCLDISTNVNLDGVDIESIFTEVTKALSAIIGRPETHVMVLVKGSVAISFGGSKAPAAFAEIVSMGGINSQVKRELISTIGSILHKTLSVPTSRFVLKVHDTTAGRINHSRM
ncbi:uncharacterized protein LOC132285282 [Cornus florida]|uniref:uncharacterized protein LOC132285282 n=1 Tax=Cornus florida TaxID=4283 RepID=UPI00289CC09C|nr:uncharacterized protein LOC132285282 [Cornus florida]